MDFLRVLGHLDWLKPSGLLWQFSDGGLPNPAKMEMNKFYGKGGYRYGVSSTMVCVVDCDGCGVECCWV